MVGLNKISALNPTATNPLLAEWGSIPLPKAVIQDTGGKSFSDISFSTLPTFNTNFNPNLSLASIPPSGSNPPVSELLMGDEFATKFSQHTTGLTFGDVVMMV